MQQLNIYEPLPLGLPAPNRKRSRLPVLILALMFLLGCLCYFLVPMGTEASSSASSSPLFQRDCFTLVDGTLYFDEEFYDPYPVLIVPAAIDGNPVTAIADGCFEGVTGITTIMLPSSITRIGDRAFADCDDLRGLDISQSVVSIGAGVFSGCDSLEALNIPLGVNSIGGEAFAGCPSLLYIFYGGFYQDWIELYPDAITPFTWVICWDGDYQHTAN